MSGLRPAEHPLRWRAPVTPAEVGTNGLRLVPNAAWACGRRADALVVLDAQETQRRRKASLESVSSLALLDVLMGLPLGCPISLADVSGKEERLLRAAPGGCVEFGDGYVTRTLQVPATVVAVVVQVERLRSSLLRIAVFSPFAQRIVVLASPPKGATVLEAQLAGVGIWIEAAGGGFEEHLAPEVFIPRYVKAAGWRFAENAYQAVLETDRSAYFQAPALLRARPRGSSSISS